MLQTISAWLKQNDKTVYKLLNQQCIYRLEYKYHKKNQDIPDSEDEESKEAFHLSFCRVQKKSNELAKLFNQAVEKAPLLLPSRDEASPPPIVFLECSVYEYTNFHGDKCGLLVGMYIA